MKLGRARNDNRVNLRPDELLVWAATLEDLRRRNLFLPFTFGHLIKAIFSGIQAIIEEICERDNSRVCTSDEL
jgi:hypothetical protein